ncbi:MAG: ABC transporter ATP-binding protein [Candidatus Hydrogenedentes bacterium]|nr:ABC transporter ATP-binding protein [Candidatus Hydrogenedentota bacterium]
MTAPAIEVFGLIKKYKRFTLGPLDLTVPSGAICGLIGTNGAGKTTTLDTIMGMVSLNHGYINVFGLDHIHHEVEIKREIGYVSPDIKFDAWGKVHRVLALFKYYFPSWDDTYCADLLARFRINPEAKIQTLSFGDRVKLALVTALAHRPKLLLLDEPLAGLDAVAKRQVFEELLHAVRNEERTVVISSHNLSELERFVDHVALLDEGKLLVQGEISVLIDRYKIVVCTLPVGLPRDRGGIYPQDREGDRYRLLVDTGDGALQRLLDHNARDIVESPITLEDLFIGLVKRGRRHDL